LARKVDEAAQLVSVQLTEHEEVWIQVLSKQYKRLNLNCHRRRDAPTLYKHPVALIYNLFNIYFRRKYNLCHPSFTWLSSGIFSLAKIVALPRDIS
jgi:hypothetical protein